MPLSIDRRVFESFFAVLGDDSYEVRIDHVEANSLSLSLFLPDIGQIVLSLARKQDSLVVQCAAPVDVQLTCFRKTHDSQALAGELRLDRVFRRFWVWCQMQPDGGFRVDLEIAQFPRLALDIWHRNNRAKLAIDCARDVVILRKELLFADVAGNGNSTFARCLRCQDFDSKGCQNTSHCPWFRELVLKVYSKWRDHPRRSGGDG